MQLSIRQATAQDSDAVADILGEAARWLEEMGMPMWRQDELLRNTITADVQSGLFFLAEYDGEPAGTIRYQLEDRLFWPDVRRTTQRSLIGSLSEDVLPEEMFLRLSSFGPSPVRINSAGAISAWIAKRRAGACKRSTNVSDFAFTATGRSGLTTCRGMNLTCERFTAEPVE